MITLILILTILVAGLPFNKLAVSAQWFTRLSSIAIIFSSLLIVNIFYGDRLYDGLSIYSGFISLNTINQTFQILLLLTGGFIVASIVNFIPSFNLTASSQNSQVFDQPSLNYLKNYSFIILFNLIGASCLLSAGDLLTIYITVEIQSFSLYILSTLKNNSAKSASAGLKYFLIGSLASTLILLGIALFYYATGLTNIESIFVYYSITDWFSLDGFTAGLTEPNSPYEHKINIFNFAEMNPYYSIGIFSIILIIIGILIKVGAAPFHQWTIDVYSLVPTAVTTWLVILPKIALFVLLFQILQLVLETGNSISYSSANNSIIDWMLDDVVQNHIADLTDVQNSTFNVSLVSDWYNNFYYDQLINKIKNIYGDATYLYPNFLQIELLNTINSPIISENSYNFVSVSDSDNKDFISHIWSDYSSNMHDSLYYTFNFASLGGLTIKNLLVLISIISLIIGAIGGLYQINIKRLLAFSAINHVGFLLLALAINNKISLESFIFYLGQYTITNLNIFLILITFGYLSSLSFNSGARVLINLPSISYLANESSTSVSNNFKSSDSLPAGNDLNFITQLTGLFTNNPILTLSFVISLFSMAGIPPMLGFFAKQQVLSASMAVGFIFIAIIAINTSVISAYYYLKLIQVSTFSNNNLLTRLSAEVNKLYNGKNNLSSGPVEPKLITDKNNIFYFEPKVGTSFKLGNGFFTSTHYGISKFDPNFFTRSYFPVQQNAAKNVILNTKVSSAFVTNNVHSYLISIFTLIILFYTLKPNVLLNLTSILASYSFTL